MWREKEDELEQLRVECRQQLQQQAEQHEQAVQEQEQRLHDRLREMEREMNQRVQEAEQRAEADLQVAQQRAMELEALLEEERAGKHDLQQRYDAIQEGKVASVIVSDIKGELLCLLCVWLCHSFLSQKL